MATNEKDLTMEELYLHTFGTAPAKADEELSLEQPPAYRIVDSFTTYGAYEDPIQ